MREHSSRFCFSDQTYWRQYGADELNARFLMHPNVKTAKNVIVFIGDGMGVQTHTAARIYKGQKEGRSGEESVLEWEKFPYTGQSKTYNTDFQVPDSAGTATALFTGVKTRMAVLGIDNKPSYNTCDPNLVEKSKLKSLLHQAVADGKATGIVTNTRVTHATPGALYAHTQNRNWEADSSMPDEYYGKCDDIAKQLIYSDVGQKINLVFGGGRQNFLTKAQGGIRNDEDLIAKWKSLKRGENHQVLLSKLQLEEWTHTDYALGLFSSSHMSYVLDRDDESEPSLDMMTKQAILRLQKGPNGFFLMVEGGRIDQAHHKNWAKKALEETLELEKAVQVALELTNPDETLIVVTADHSHAMTINGYPHRGNDILGYVYNEERELWNEQPDGSRAAWSTISYANGLGFLDHFTNDALHPWRDIREMDFTDDQYRSPAMVNPADGYETHGGEDVPILAYGPWAHLMVGVHEESYICHVIEHAFGWRKDSRHLHASSQAMQHGIYFPLILLFSLVQQ